MANLPISGLPPLSSGATDQYAINKSGVTGRVETHQMLSLPTLDIAVDGTPFSVANTVRTINSTAVVTLTTFDDTEAGQVAITNGTRWRIDATGGIVTIAPGANVVLEYYSGSSIVAGAKVIAVGVSAVLIKISNTLYRVVTNESAGGGGGGQVDSVVAGAGIAVDATDPVNPVVALSAAPDRRVQQASQLFDSTTLALSTDLQGFTVLAGGEYKFTGVLWMNTQSAPSEGIAIDIDRSPTFNLSPIYSASKAFPNSLTAPAQARVSNGLGTLHEYTNLGPSDFVLIEIEWYFVSVGGDVDIGLLVGREDAAGALGVTLHPGSWIEAERLS